MKNIEENLDKRWNKMQEYAEDKEGYPGRENPTTDHKKWEIFY
jgi:hypothetical protein